MPKYTPTPEDMYKVTPCFICGGDAIDGETCSDICEQQMIIFKEDWEWFQWKDYEENDYLGCNF
jgi:hypothetical protein